MRERKRERERDKKEVRERETVKVGRFPLLLWFTAVGKVSDSQQEMNISHFWKVKMSNSCTEPYRYPHGCVLHTIGTVISRLIY